MGDISRKLSLSMNIWDETKLHMFRAGVGNLRSVKGHLDIFNIIRGP